MNGTTVDNRAEKYLEKDDEVELPVATEEDEEDDGRHSWSKKIDFLLHIVGFAVDLANIWRFPFLCYIYGGGAFLIPYFLMLCFGAAPLFYLELIIGQFNRESCVSVWKIVPVFKGVGIAQLLISGMVATYYMAINGWSIFYFFNSFNDELPWMSCTNKFNTKYCATIDDIKLRAELKANVTKYNETRNVNFNVSDLDKPQYFAATEFFERGALGLHESKGLHDLGGIQWRLALSVLMAYLVLFLGLRKGLKSSAKMVYLTATLPYILLTVMLVNGVLLPGAGHGILTFITPDFSQLANLEVWSAAAVQIFYSVGAGFGVHIAFASYNKRNNNCYRDFLITCAANSTASILSGFVVFAYLGHMAFLTSKKVSEVATMGPGLVFTVYPFALGTLPAAPFWSVIFFLLLTSLGMDTALGGMEAIITGFKDNFKEMFNKSKHSRQIQTAVFIAIFYCLSLIITTKGGFHVLQLMDLFVASASLMFAAWCQGVAISWFYGMRQICADAKSMLGFSPGIYWRICWKFVSPLFVGAIIILGFLFPLNYEVVYGAWHPELFPSVATNYTHIPPLVYPFPHWAISVGWTLTAIPMIVILAVFLFQIFRYQSFTLAVSPTSEHIDLRNGHPSKRSRWQHWLSIGPLDWWPANLCLSPVKDTETRMTEMFQNGDVSTSRQQLAQSNGSLPRVYF